MVALSKKVKYIYSQESQQFEPHKVSVLTKVLRILGLLSAVVVSAWIIVALAFKYIGSPKEKRMQQDVVMLKSKYNVLRKNLKQTEDKLSELRARDNEIYRVIFETDPLPELTFEKNKVVEKRLFESSNEEIIESIQSRIDNIQGQVSVQKTSYDSLVKLIENKESMLASIPSIQPVSNKNLKRMASGFGYRIDPIYKIKKFHAGLDFSAPQGTPIYATGDGEIVQANYSNGGYGNQIWIDHGYGYRTHYCHMVKIKKTGGSVKRGEVIGYVGSTGKSTGPHLHYEVERRGAKIDPVHFFYNDLAVEDYDKMLEIARRSNQSFD